MSETQGIMTLPPDSDLQAGQAQSIAVNSKQLLQIYKIAQTYSRSTMVPTQYQNNPDNCFVAVELALRMNVSATLVMQNLYVVRGKPSWSGQACKALIDGCGHFERSEYVFVGERGSVNWGCYFQAFSKRLGKMVKGTTITWQMALDEGWANKDGSKWKTMPEQMFKYRAAAFFARTECPEVLMGFQIDSEVEDVTTPEPQKIVLSLNKGGAQE